MVEPAVVEHELRSRYPGVTVCRDEGAVVVRIPVSFYRRNGRTMIVAGDGHATELSPERAANHTLIHAMANAYRWQERLESGEYTGIEELASEMGVDRTYVARFLRLTCLAPDIVQAIVDGQEPEGISLEQLRRDLPASWEEQRKRWKLDAIA